MTCSPREFFTSDGEGRHVHLVGVCGIGMAGVAFLLARRGFRVSGCDACRNQLAPWLESAGVTVVCGHHVGHLADNVSAVVRSAAVPVDAPEIAEALRRAIPVFRRGEVLPALLVNRVSIAVSGTHGKTTTSTFIARILQDAGQNPSWCIGGEVDALGGVAGEGDGPFVVEADESDGTVALYAPDVAVVTNIEFDHMEHFESVESFEDCFRSLISQARREVVYCGDDPRAVSLSRDARLAVSYGFGDCVDFQGRVLRRPSGCVSFDVLHLGCCLGRVDLPVPGEHNALNALAAVVVGLRMGVDFVTIKRGLEVAALPRRRYECLADIHGVRVISDYAHHPTEVAAVLAAAREERCDRRLAVFQPHRYTRTRALGRDFPPSFSGLSQLILTPVYAASEQPLSGGTVWDLYAQFRQMASPTQGEVGAVCVAESLQQVERYLIRELRTGDLLLVIGAGDVEAVAHAVAGELLEKGCPVDRAKLVAELRSLAPGSQVTADAPLGRKTTLGVGGKADLFVSVGDVEDLARLVALSQRTSAPLRVMGGGAMCS